MATQLKYKTGDKVIYRHGVGGFKITEYDAIIMYADEKRRLKLPPYIIRTAKFDTFSLERDIKKVP